MTHFDRATRVLVPLLATAFAVSVIHYLDNTINYADYPVPGPDAAVPAPSQFLVGSSWFLFTAFGALALWFWFRRQILAAATALALYSVSGLIGVGHYTVPGATSMPWWRQAHVVLDIACGFAIVGFALWAALRRDELRAGFAVDAAG